MNRRRKALRDYLAALRRFKTGVLSAARERGVDLCRANRNDLAVLAEVFDEYAHTHDVGEVEYELCVPDRVPPAGVKSLDSLDNEIARWGGNSLMSGGIIAWRQAAARMGYSSLVAPFSWTGLVLAPEGVYEAKIFPFRAENPTFTLFRSSTDNGFIVKTRSIPDVQLFLSRARFPVTRYRVEKDRSIVEYEECGLSWKPLLRIEFNEQQEVVAVGWIEH